MAEDSRDSDATYQKLLGYFDSALNSPVWISYLKNAIKCFEFREGNQWTEDEKKELKKRKQAPIVENLIKPIIDRLTGQQRKQKTRIIYRGRNVGQDEETGNIMSDLAHYCLQRSSYDHEESDSFDDGLVSGFGCLDVGIAFENGLPQAVISHEDCLSIFPDPYSREYDWNKDARFICRTKWVTIDDAKALYPGKADIIDGAKDGISPGGTYKSPGVYTDDGLASAATSISDTFKKENYVKDRRIRLIEIWFKENKTRQIAFPIEGKAVDITDVKPRVLSQIRKMPGITFYPETVSKMKMAVFCFGGILEEKDSPYEHGLFPFVPYFVHRKKDGEPYSFVIMLLDPQTENNKRRSKALHLLSANKIILERGAVTDIDELKLQNAMPDGVIEHKKGFKLEIAKNIDMADSQMQLMAESKQAIREIAGFNPSERQEIRSGDQLQRKQMIDDLPSVLIFENLRRTRGILGKILHGLIRQYFTAEMVFNITDDMNVARKVELTEGHLAVIKEAMFDVIIEDMPDTTTIQDAQFGMLTQFIQGLNLPPQVTMALMPILLKTSQLRNKEEISKMIESLSKIPPDQPKISIQIDWSNISPEEKVAFAVGPMQNPQLAEAVQINPIPPTNVIKAQEGIEKTRIKAQSDMEKAHAGKADPEVEMAMKQQEMDLKEREHGMKMQHQSEDHQMKMAQRSMEHSMNAEQSDQAHGQKMLQSALDAQVKRQQMSQANKKDKRDKKKG